MSGGAERPLLFSMLRIPGLGRAQAVHAMIYWPDLHDCPRRLTSGWGHSRIFAPEAYERVRNRQLVPIVHGEALTLAAWFPICWQMWDGRPVLCVLRSLLPDGTGHPVRPSSASGALPAALRAFPVILNRVADDAPEIWIDDVVADQPTDIGAPLLMSDGRLSRGAAQRVHTVMMLRRSIDRTESLTDALHGAGLLEPWPLDFEVGPAGQRARFDDLRVVRASALASTAAIQLLRTFGADAATFLTAHRISLFRIAVLIQAARAQLKSARAPEPVA